MGTSSGGDQSRSDVRSREEVGVGPVGAVPGLVVAVGETRETPGVEFQHLSGQKIRAEGCQQQPGEEPGRLPARVLRSPRTLGTNQSAGWSSVVATGAAAEIKRRTAQ